MNLALWITQALLAAIFAAAGAVKLARPIDVLAQTLGEWVHAFPPVAVRLLGAAEVAAAIGLLVPAAAGIAPALTPAAAAGVIVVMIGATVVHVRHRESVKVPVTLIIAAAALFVCWGRLGPESL
ncbi:DoxX family protein [Nocardia beijingensis]|uniref:DoxX family protein n=1 Tax=Nocardia beijingensis TaxID=95162 RepID=UPI00344D09D1